MENILLKFLIQHHSTIKHLQFNLLPKFKTAYTTIIPGSFFTGSSVEYNNFEGINTDAANPSTLTVTTDTAHGFSTNTSVYITNTVGKELTLSNTTTSAPDGDNYVDTTLMMYIYITIKL